MSDEHYFSRDPKAEGGARAFRLTLRGHAFTFVTEAGVFSLARLDRGTRLMLKEIAITPTDRVLDLGCGWVRSVWSPRNSRHRAASPWWISMPAPSPWPA